MTPRPLRKLPDHLRASFDRLNEIPSDDPDLNRQIAEHNAAVRAWHAEQDAAEQDAAEQDAGGEGVRA